MYLGEYAGRGIRIAVVDSGVHAEHPHVRGVDQGVGVRADGSVDEDFIDRLGHGTAVAAAIREKAPAASLIAVKVFWDTLATNVSALVHGIDEASARGAAIINLSLGTPRAEHRAMLEAAVERAAAHGAVLVSALDDGGVGWLPGSLAGVMPVHLDWECPRDEYRITRSGNREIVATSGYPRDIPNVPRERNLKGISFAVANATGFIARALEAAASDAAGARSASVSRVFEILKAGLR